MEIISETKYSPKWDFEYDYGYYPHSIIYLFKLLIENDIAFVLERSDVSMAAFQVMTNNNTIIRRKTAYMDPVSTFRIGENGSIMLFPSTGNKRILSTGYNDHNQIISYFNSNDFIKDSATMIKISGSGNKRIEDMISIMKLFKIMFAEGFRYKQTDGDSFSIFEIHKEDIFKKHKKIILETSYDESQYCLNVGGNSYYLDKLLSRFESLDKIINEAYLFENNSDLLNLPF